MGDPAGIGPEVALKACMDARIAAVCQPVVIASRGIMERVAGRLGLPVPESLNEPRIPGFDAAAILPGEIHPLCGAAAGACIEAAIAGCLRGDFDAMVTGPINKTAIAAAGIDFPGHTEWIASRCGVTGETMMMYHPDIAVALATCHQPLLSVPGSLSPERLITVTRQFHSALKRLRGRKPRLAICGFNPHAGEGGLFGSEDEMVLPAVYELLQLGLDVEGPLPADTAFAPPNRRRFDGWVCLYHDQGLIPFKALAFEDGVNVTLGLPIVRTSVDHGTAFDIAWHGKAEHRSLIAAIELAARLVLKEGSAGFPVLR
ncbi:MAG: 4-hydroxythreonine-4-phosphate dehydrogenase PdxA [Planctomycetes bacterium]|nr:4-hydroxythreonine-4-phosphate dehydrogenase PdxA [Planctomycetota bacterium]